MSEFIGPALPPHLLNSIPSSESIDHSENSHDIQRNTPKSMSIGPTLPPHLFQEISEDIITSSTGTHRAVIQVNDIGSSELPLETNCNSTNESIIGPALPPKLRTKFKRKVSKTSESSDEEPIVMGPVLPPHLKNSSDEEDSQDSLVNVCVIGSKLPPFLTSKTDKQLPSEPSSNRKSVQSIIGPSLPPHIKSKRDEELPTIVEDATVNDHAKPIIGPVLPPHLLKSKEPEKDRVNIYGPALPPGLSQKSFPSQISEDEALESDEDIGPLPEGVSVGSRAQHQLEIRALQLRAAMSVGETSTTDAITQRESWMLELPANRAPELGLKPRQFRMREGPEAGDRSVWTDTPVDRERKKKAPKSRSPDRGALEKQAIKQRDKAMQQLAEQHSNKRGTRSLVEMHEEKLLAKRKKSEESGEVQERRPFSREVDLQVNRFDEAQKKSILKKAQHLNDRFSSGNSKFL